MFQFVSNWVCLIELQKIWKRTDGIVVQLSHYLFLSLVVQNWYCLTEIGTLFNVIETHLVQDVTLFENTDLCLYTNCMKSKFSEMTVESSLILQSDWNCRIVIVAVGDLAHYSKFTVSKLLKCSLKRTWWRCSRTLIFVYTQIVWNLVKSLLSLVCFFSLIEFQNKENCDGCCCGLVPYSSIEIVEMFILKRIYYVNRTDQGKTHRFAHLPRTVYLVKPYIIFVEK